MGLVSAFMLLIELGIVGVDDVIYMFLQMFFVSFENM